MESFTKDKFQLVNKKHFNISNIPNSKQKLQLQFCRSRQFSLFRSTNHSQVCNKESIHIGASVRNMLLGMDPWWGHLGMIDFECSLVILSLQHSEPSCKAAAVIPYGWKRRPQKTQINARLIANWWWRVVRCANKRLFPEGLLAF